MNLLVIRHGEAEDVEAWGQTGEPDERRPLTRKGRKKMKKAARGLSEVVEHVDLLASSALTRARETAEIVAREFDDAPVAVTTALDPAQTYPAFLEWVRTLGEVETVAVVGHEPQLSGLVSWLLTAGERKIIELKNGAACLLELEPQTAPGNGTLLWLLTPGQLRDLRD